MMRAAIRLGARAIGTVADHDQAARHGRERPLEHADHVHDPLHRTEVRDVADQLVARRAEHVAERAVIALEARAIDEVRDHLDGLVGVKVRRRLVLQPLRHGSDAVGDLDPEFRDRQIALVASDQRDVRAVQRGDHLQIGAEDLLREVRADRMRNRVVDVQDVELLVRRDLGHLRRQRERVRRIRIEQRIRRDRDFVKVHALVQEIEPRRQRVADEVHLVPAPRQREPELRRDHAGAAEGGIAGDADFHIRWQTADCRRQKNRGGGSAICRLPSAVSVFTSLPFHHTRR